MVINSSFCHSQAKTPSSCPKWCFHLSRCPPKPEAHKPFVQNPPGRGQSRAVVSPAPMNASSPSLAMCQPQARLTQVEGGVAVAGEVVDVGDAEGLDGHAADAQQGLGHEHHQQHLLVLPGAAGRAAGIAQVGPSPRGPGLAQVRGVAEGA